MVQQKNDSNKNNICAISAVERWTWKMLICNTSHKEAIIVMNKAHCSWLQTLGAMHLCRINHTVWAWERLFVGIFCLKDLTEEFSKHFYWSLCYSILGKVQSNHWFPWNRSLATTLLRLGLYVPGTDLWHQHYEVHALGTYLWQQQHGVYVPGRPLNGRCYKEQLISLHGMIK